MIFSASLHKCNISDCSLFAAQYLHFLKPRPFIYSPPLPFLWLLVAIFVIVIQDQHGLSAALKAFTPWHT